MEVRGAGPEPRPPGGRRIRAGDFEAAACARSLVADAEEEAARIRGRALEELERARAEGRAAGREEGRQEGLGGAVAALLAAERARDRLLAAARGDLLDAAGALARRILGREVALAPGLVLEMAERALAEAHGRRRVVLRAHPDDLVTLGQGMERLAVARGAAAPVLRGDAGMERGGVVVEADGAVLDATLEAQVDALLEALRRELDVEGVPVAARSAGAPGAGRAARGEP
jgi:flagellar assembly protein FliH